MYSLSLLGRSLVMVLVNVLQSATDSLAILCALQMYFRLD